MEDFKLNVSGEADTNKVSMTPPEKHTLGVKSENFLGDIPLHQISKVFASFSTEKRVVVIPIGFPQAGKSLLLSSLMYFAVKGKELSFRTNFENDFPFNNGRKAVDKMIEYFDTGKIYATTTGGTIDLIGINITPNKKYLPVLKLAFLDLAGEDIQKIKISNESQFTNKINAVFNGLLVDDDPPIIFTLITPFEPVQRDTSPPHHSEDTLLYDFLNYLKQNQKKLLKNSKFFIVVSQWDKNPDSSLTVEEFIRLNRPSVYNYVKNLNVVWGEYSIGKILTTIDDAGITTEEIVRISNEHPKRYWNMLYQICTGKRLKEKTWFQKIFE